EWLGTPDDKICPACSALQGIVLKVKEAHGLIPRHPNCFVSKSIRITTVGKDKPISGIVVGDRVLTHLGRYRKVIQVHKTEMSTNRVDVVDIVAVFGDREDLDRQICRLRVTTE